MAQKERFLPADPKEARRLKSMSGSSTQSVLARMLFADIAAAPAFFTPERMDSMNSDVRVGATLLDALITGGDQYHEAMAAAMRTGAGAVSIGLDMAAGPDRTVGITVKAIDIMRQPRKCICCGLPEHQVTHD